MRVGLVVGKEVFRRCTGGVQEAAVPKRLARGKCLLVLLLQDLYCCRTYYRTVREEEKGEDQGHVVLLSSMSTYCVMGF